MSDKITEVTEKSWGSRIMDSIKGVAIGALLFIASFPVLWMNEGCAVRTARGLEEGAGNVISVSADTVETANNGKLVHLSGEAKTDEVLKDAIFNIGANAIMLERTVEMYQWEEKVETKTEKQTGGKEVETKTYSYNRV